MSRFSPPCLSVNLSSMEKVPASELTPTRLGFPNEFPYEFDSPAFSPGFTSPGNSTESEDESSDDEEDFLAGLTRRLAPSTQRRRPPPTSTSLDTKVELKPQFAATSPQSTLSGLGSFSNSGIGTSNIPPSPLPMTSYRRDNSWDVISAAAGEVARLKLGSYGSHLPRQTPNPNSLLRQTNAALQADHRLQQQRLYDHLLLCSQSRIKSSENHFPRKVVNNEVTFGLSNPPWIPQHVGTPLKRPSTGTGVFLPRRYPATPSEPYKKLVNTTTTLHSKVNPQNLNINEFANVASRRSQYDYDCLFSRGTVLARQGNHRAVGSGCLNQELLPQDWMY